MSKYIGMDEQLQNRTDHVSTAEFIIDFIYSNFFFVFNFKFRCRIESLLPTQVLQNILFNKGGDSSKYSVELIYNETQFCNTQFDAIVGFQVERQTDVAKFDDFELWFEQNCFDWANAALTGRSQGQLLQQIKSRTVASYENVG